MPDERDASSDIRSFLFSDAPTRLDLWKWLVLPLVGGTLAVISWQKWQDLIVDFGQQVYVPWQLSEGAVLYRDIFYIYGPLSSYVHALLFKLFGPGILVLAGFNMALIVVLTVVIYYLFKDLTNTQTAHFACLTFLGVFAFGQYKLGGNYNFVCAYVYELPHGVLLSFLALFQFKKYLDDPSFYRMGVLGLLTGLVFLTKPEVFFAEAAAIGTGLGLTLYFKPSPGAQKVLLPFLGGAALPPLVAIGLLGLAMPLGESVQSVFGPYRFLFSPELRSVPLYQWIMGTNELWTNVFLMGLYGLVFALILVMVFLINRKLNDSIQKYFVGFSLTTGLLLAYALLATPGIPWLSLGRPLPLFMMIFVGILGWRILKQKSRPASQTLGQFVLVVFALVLLLKIVLNAHVYHYGFALALPATLVVVAFMMYELPRRLQPVLGSTRFYQSVMMTLVIVFVGYHAWFASLIYDLKNYPVGKGRDRVIDYDRDFNNRGEVMNLALNYIEEHIPKESGWVTFPDGIMLNYLARRESPVSDITLNPGVWLLVGDEAVLKRLETAAPDYMVYMDREFPYFGLNRFGQDFAQKIDAWVKTNYTLQAQIGPAPFTGKGFGIQFFYRKER